MKNAAIKIRTSQKLGRIRPELYGHFAEHLGRCIDEGVWVGPESDIPNEDGIRTDTVAALAKVNPPVVRWPGGCFADNYHWEDGIGPRDERPRRNNLWWDQVESNEFGTHEFIDACRHLGTDPFICMNVGSGTPQEALDWLEYCNGASDTMYSRMRSVNGSSDPWNVRWWAIGNENWGCGGRFTARDYAKEYRRFATYLHRFDSSLEFVVCGDTRENWNTDLLDELRDAPEFVDHLSIHRYVHGGPGLDFDSNQYAYLMSSVDIMEEDILAAAGAVRAFTRDERFIGIVLDEWGVWHPEAVTDNGLLQPNTLRDGLFAASALHMFHRHNDVLTMTNLAQTINVLQCLVETDGPKMALTPTYHVYEMLAPHQGAQLVFSEVDTPRVPYIWENSDQSIPALDCSASVDENGTLTISVVNRDADAPIEADIMLEELEAASVSARCLSGPATNSVNTPGETPISEANDVPAALSDGRIQHTFEPRSLTVFRVSP
jgi:alpha-L-arabinofuranosidase